MQLLESIGSLFIKSFLVSILIGPTVTEEVCHRISPRGLERKLRAAKKSFFVPFYPVLTFEEAFLHQVDPEGVPDICSDTNRRKQTGIFDKKSYPGWYRTLYALDTRKTGSMPVYPQLLPHNKCCDTSCRLPDAQGNYVEGEVRQRFEDTVVLQQLSGCNRHGFKRYRPIIIRLSKSCHCTYN